MESDEFRKQVKDALEHLYDTVYLQVHPLLHQLTAITTSPQATRAQKLRSLLKDAIEALRPQPLSSSDSPEWRSYLALRYRYVQGMSLAQIEIELGISLRQLQRELRKGLDALSNLLWEMHMSETSPAVGSSQSTLELDLVQELESELSQWRLARQPLKVQALVDDTLWMLKPLLEQREVVLEIDLPADLPPVLADPTLTRQALYKILQFLTLSSHCELSVGASQGNGQVSIILIARRCTVSISEEEWQIAQLLASQQGGQLVLSSLPEEGVQVTLSLPKPSQTRVLVVDDNQAIHQLFERYLALHQYEVIHAFSGDEALHLAVETAPDLITLDVMMPNMDGWQVLRSLTQSQATAHIPVVICSVLREPEMALSLGARAYLKKPVDRLELVTTLNQLRGAAPSSAAPPPGPAGS